MSIGLCVTCSRTDGDRKNQVMKHILHTVLLTEWGMKLSDTNDFNGSSSLIDNLPQNENVRYGLQVVFESFKLGERFV